ncbi:MAG: TolC family protein [Desulfobacterales bacterium]|nr:TolC family protein [Desulfobacterales bacterium]
MKIKRNWIFHLTLMTASALLIQGCVYPKNHTYESIQKEYADIICNITPTDDMVAAQDGCIMDKKISLREAVSIAISNNPDSKIAVSRIMQAYASLEKTNAPFLPAIGFYTEYMQGDSPSAYLFKTVDRRELPAAADFNYPGWFENYETGVNVRMNLYKGGKDIMNHRMAERELEAMQYDRRRVENELITAVIHSYYNCLSAKKFVDIAIESVETVESQLKVMTVRYNAGGALRSDILTLDVRLAEAMEESVRSKNNLEISMAVLANVLGADPDSRILLSEENTCLLTVPEDYDAGITHALLYRPELNKLRAHLRQSRIALDAAKTDYYPTVDFETRYYFDDENMNYDRDKDNWTAGILLNWDIFTGFSTVSDTKKAEAVVEELLAADRKTGLDIKLDVKTAYLKLDGATARLNVAKRSVAMAEESLKLVKQQYEGGSATITRYLEAELDNNRSKIRATAAFYDREKALADVGRAIGFWSKPFTSEQDSQNEVE